MRCVVLCFAAALNVIAQIESGSIVSDAQVQVFVESELGNPVLIDTGFKQHFACLLGDRLAVAISKKVRLLDLRDPEKGRRILLLLRYAFATPSFIQAEADRAPGTTLLLLDLLEDQSSDPTVRLAAASLAHRIEALKMPRVQGQPRVRRSPIRSGYSVSQIDRPNSRVHED
jgi:hypothetical protein